MAGKHWVCSNCGSISSRAISGGVVCAKCGANFPNVAENVDITDQLTKLISTGKTEQIGIFRKNLRKELGKQLVDSADVLGWCKELKKIYPEDYLAGFYTAYFTKEVGNAEYKKYLEDPNCRIVCEPNVFLKEAMAFAIKHVDVTTDDLANGFIEKICEQVNSHLVEGETKLNCEDFKQQLTTQLKESIKKQELYAKVHRNVFICYVSDDIEIAKAVYDYLMWKNLTCFLSDYNIPKNWTPGCPNYKEAIEWQINNIDVFLVISSINLEYKDRATNGALEEIDFAGGKNDFARLEYKIDEHTAKYPRTATLQNFVDGKKWIKRECNDDKLAALEVAVVTEKNEILKKREENPTATTEAKPTESASSAQNSSDTNNKAHLKMSSKKWTCLIVLAIILTIILNVSIFYPRQKLIYSLMDDGSGYAVIDADYYRTKKVTIPSKYKNTSVVKIGADVFYNESELEEINLPYSISSIDNNAFNGCSSLASINVAEDNANYSSIEGNLYNKDGSMLVRYPAGKTATSFTIPASVTTICDGAFNGCTALISVAIPASVTEIGKEAFSGCTSIDSVNVAEDNNNFKSIEGNLYSKDGATLIQYIVGKTATSFTIPAGVTTIGDGAFNGCTSIISVTIPAGVTTIGGSAFNGCTSLTSVTIPASVTTIGYQAFGLCTGLTIYAEAASKPAGWHEDWKGSACMVVWAYNTIKTDSQFNYKEIDNQIYLVEYKGSDKHVEIPASIDGKQVVAIGNIFRDKDVISVKIPKCIKSIDVENFVGCNVLKSINIEEGNTNYSSIDGNLYSKDGATLIRYCAGKPETRFAIPTGVTTIGDSAFNGCAALTSITIPNSVAAIGKEALAVCTSLTNINVADDNNNFKSVDGNLYSKDGTILVQYAICKTATSFAIPSSVTTIGGGAFSGCKSLTSVTIPNSVTTIGHYAFYDCTALTSATIPSSVIEKGIGSVFDLNAITSITLQDGVTTVSGSAFNGCTALTSINVAEGNSNFKSIDGNLYSKDGLILVRYPAGKTATSFEVPLVVTTIGEEAFKNCTALKSVTIPNSVTTIDHYAFYDCTSLTSVTIPASVIEKGIGTVFDLNAITSITLQDSVTTIGASAFKNCTALTSVSIPASVKTISEMAFAGCSKLTSVTIPSSVIEKGIGSVFDLNAITSITLQDGVTAIDYGDFNGCTALTSASIPASVKTISERAFAGCSKLTSINVEESNKNYKSIDGNLYSKDGSMLLCSPAGKNATSFTIPAGVTEIGNSAFYGCTALTSVTIPTSVTTISMWAFDGCSKLTSLTIPESVTAIDYRSFIGCKSLTSINVAASNTNYKSIDGNLYSKDGSTLICSPAGKNATSFTIPSSVSKIDWHAFNDCSGLTSINVAYDNTNFKSIDGNLYSKDGSILVRYAVGKKATSFAIPEGVTSIDSHAFNSSAVLTNVTIPNSLTISESAFNDCKLLTSINVAEGNNKYKSIDGNLYSKDGSTLVRYAIGKTATSFAIPEGVTSIERYVFDGCTTLTTVTIPLSVTAIYDRAFVGCKSLTSVTIPASVNVIGEKVFMGCTSLASVTIPAGVEVIGEYAFAGCTSLTSVSIPSSVTTICREAFAGCKSLTSITIPASVAAIRDYAFNGCTTLTIYAEAPSKPDTWWDDWNPSNRPVVWEYNIIKTNPDYDYLTNNNEVYLTKYKGSNLDVVIPATIEGKAVVSFGEIFKYNTTIKSVQILASVTIIGYWDFRGCTSLTSITIPASVTAISKSTFDDCKLLTSVNVAEGNNNFKSIDGNLYSKDGSTLIQYATGKPETMFTIPAGVTTIGKSAFKGCASLTSITIPESVTAIGDQAFYGCTSLTSVTIPAGVTAIRAYAFHGCKSLTSVTFEAGSKLTIIGSYAFYGCTSLTSVTIPAGVTIIGYAAFEYCSSLTRVTIPASVTEIGRDAFDGCTALTIYAEVPSPPASWDRDWNPDNRPVNWRHNNITTNADYDYVINNNEVYLTKYKGNALDVVIPDSIDGKMVVSFGTIFKGNTTIKSVQIPASVTSIGNSTFKNSTSLANTIENGNRGEANSVIENGFGFIGDEEAPSIGDVIQIPGSKEEDPDGLGEDWGKTFNGAFSSCSSLTSVIIPSSVTIIGDDAFAYCRSLTSITIPAGVTAISNYAFAYCSSLTTVTIPLSVTAICDRAFVGCKSLTSVTIPPSVTTIGSSAFDNCTSLTSVTFEAGSKLTIIGSYAFYDCTSLTSISIPANVKTIGEGVFAGCSKLTSVTISASVIEKGLGYVFNCNILTSITIQDGVTTVSGSAFNGCSSLININIADGNKNFKAIDGNLYSKDGSILVRYPAGKTATNFEVPLGVKTIGESAFKGCKSLTEMTISNSITAIGNHAFDSCSSLTSVTIPNSVTTIENRAFKWCKSLISVTIPNSVTNIGDLVFYGCTSLTSINVEEGNKKYKSVEGNLYSKDGTTLIQYATSKKATSFVIPTGVIEIGYYAFWGCKLLTNITIPASLTNIRSYAFRYCTSLKSITIPAGVTTIGASAFHGCTALQSVTIPASVTYIGYEAFSGCTALQSVTIPASVTYIGCEAFSGCTALTSVTISVGVEVIGEYAFHGCTALTIYAEAASEPVGWVGDSNSFIYWNSDCRPVVWGHNNITTNADYDYVTHNNKVYLTKYKGSNLDVVIPATIDGKAVVSFGSTFSGNTTIKSVQIPASVTAISDYAFDGCSSLTSVTFEAGSKLTTIGEGAFYCCSSLTSVTIPVSVTEIGEYAFSGCTALTIYAEAASEPAGWVSDSDSWNSDRPVVLDCANNIIAFDGNIYAVLGGIRYALKDGNATVVRQSSTITTANIPVTVTFKNVTYNVTSIGGSAFISCSSLTSITIPTSVTSIGNYAFRGCNSLTSVTFEAESKLTSIGSDAFDGCSSLTSITIPTSVTSIGNYAFRGCNSLTSVTFEAESKLTSIGSAAFDGCSSLTSVTIPASVTAIGKWAFDGCTSLTSITIPVSVTRIGYKVFNGCTALTIYAEAPSQPAGWDSEWNPNNRPVVWGSNGK